MRVINFIFTLYLFLVLLCFVGSFFNVMVVGPTKPKGGGGGGGGEGAGKGGKPFCCSFPTLVQSWREGGGGELLELREIESLESEFGAFLFQRWLVQVKSSFWEIGRSW